MPMWFVAAASIAAAVLLYACLVALHNASRFPRLTAPPASSPPTEQVHHGGHLHRTGTPAISILIPARNEADGIAGIIRDIRSQTAADFELIILDDNSVDCTRSIAQDACAEDPRCRVIAGTPPPSGWLGKNWACHQLAQHAQGDLLVFVDADVRWQPTALAAILNARQGLSAGLLSIWPTQHTVTWSERLIVPLMSFVLLAYLPVSWAHDARMVQAAAANGQCLVFTRPAYKACGGHTAVRGHVLDDVALALRIKHARQPLRLIDGAGLIACRMYTGWRAVLLGYSKNILAAHTGSAPLLLMSTSLHLLAYTGPAAAWFWALLAGYPIALFIATTLFLAGVGARALTAQIAGLRRRDAWLMPISVLLMAMIAFYAIWRALRHGGSTWKGRHIPSGTGVTHGK